MDNIPIVDVTQIEDKTQARDYANRLCCDLNSCMHEAVRKCVPSKDTVYSETRSGRSKKSWWSSECRTARNRNRLYFYLWKCAGRASSGQTYECYKYARKVYKRTCRYSFKSQEQKRFSMLDNLCSRKQSKLLWNKIRQTKKTDKSQDFSHIEINSLENYFSEKFCKPTSETELTVHASKKVTDKYNSIKNKIQEVHVSEYFVRSAINKLNNGCASGLDGITSEHLKYAVDSMLILQLSVLFSICLTYGVIPDTFCAGLLVPILKKSNLDPKVPGNYRPITVSSVLSKILEIYILEQVKEYNPAKCQFGFVSGKGTSMAAVMAHDISAFCTSKGSCVYMCRLDVQGAFDTLPTDIILLKVMDLIPSTIWNVLYYWYKNMYVNIRWGNVIGRNIQVNRGTRQGGISSTFLFNAFYGDLVNDINNENCGVTIDGMNYNVFCYADDILLCSLTASGLQSLVDLSVTYIENHGLRFNPEKSNSIIYGKCSLNSTPNWSINGQSVKIASSVTYLGTDLDGTFSGNHHTQHRIRAAQKAFLCPPGCWS